MSVCHLNQKQLAARWNISAYTLERWRWLGQGPRFLKIGNLVRYSLHDIEAFEAQQLRQTAPCNESDVASRRYAAVAAENVA